MIELNAPSIYKTDRSIRERRMVRVYQWQAIGSLPEHVISRSSQEAGDCRTL